MGLSIRHLDSSFSENFLALMPIGMSPLEASLMRKLFTCRTRREQAMLVLSFLTLVATVVAIVV